MNNNIIIDLRSVAFSFGVTQKDLPNNYNMDYIKINKNFLTLCKYLISKEKYTIAITMELISYRKYTIKIDKVFAMYGLLIQKNNILKANYSDNEDIALAKLVKYVIENNKDYSWLSNISNVKSPIYGRIFPSIINDNDLYKFDDELKKNLTRLNHLTGKDDPLHNTLLFNFNEFEINNDFFKINIYDNKINYSIDGTLVGTIDSILNFYEMDNYLKNDLSIIIRSVELNSSVNSIILKGIPYYLSNTDIPNNLNKEFKNIYGLFSEPLKDEIANILYKMFFINNEVRKNVLWHDIDNNSFISGIYGFPSIGDYIIKTDINPHPNINKNSRLYIILNEHNDKVGHSILKNIHINNHKKTFTF